MRWRQDPVTHELIPADEAAYVAMHLVMPDIAPYRSMVDGSIIDGRAQHVEHLRRHGYTEVGNEIKHLMKQGPKDFDPEGRKEIYKRQLMNIPHDQFKKMVKQECDFIEWNSRGLPRSQ